MVTRRAWAIFFSVFVVGFLIQSYFWTHFDYVDEGLWVPAATSFSAGNLFEHTALVNGYPATTILLSASALMHAGTDAKTALRLAMAFLIALAAAGAGTVAYILRPKSIAWLAIAGPLIVNHLYQWSTLPSAAFIPLAAFFLLLVLYAYEKRKYALSALGAVSGVMLATRFETSLILIGSAFIVLLLKHRWRDFIKPTGIIFVVLLLLDPYLYLNPLWHLGSTLTLFHIVGGVHQTPFTLPDVIGSSFVALLSLCLGLSLLRFRKNFTGAVPAPVIVWAAGVTVLTTTALMLFQSNGIWYFFPFLIMWETLFPLLLFPLLFSQAHDAEHQKGIRAAIAVISVLLIVSQAVLMPTFNAFVPQIAL